MYKLYSIFWLQIIWRQRHARMVELMIGRRRGTGGFYISSYSYSYSFYSLIHSLFLSLSFSLFLSLSLCLSVSPSLLPSLSLNTHTRLTRLTYWLLNQFSPPYMIRFFGSCLFGSDFSVSSFSRFVVHSRHTRQSQYTSWWQFLRWKHHSSRRKR
jgi:hypothetical protein